jgi:hypothetical protein
MENLLSQFISDNLEIKLTSEKLFINTPTSNETFALRSLNGIGVVDLVEDFNKALTIWKAEKNGGIAIQIMGFILIILGLINLLSSIGLGIFLFIISALLVWRGSVQLRKYKNNEPKLMSVVRIMMSGGNRDFQFDKMGIKSGNIAEFVALVESTLTSYHKNTE